MTFDAMHANVLAINAAVDAVLADRTTYEDLAEELDALAAAQATGDTQELVTEVRSFFLSQNCPFEDMDEVFKNLRRALDAFEPFSF